MSFTDADCFEYVYGDDEIVLNAVRSELRIDGSEVPLEPKPLGYLIAMMHSPRELQPFQRGLGPDEAGSVSVSITRIRKALGERYRSLIRNKRGQGYWFDGEVKRRLLAAGQPETSHERGDRIGPFALTAPLGARDGIEVWRARDGEHAEPVVLKLASDPAGAKRLEREHSYWRLVAKALPEGLGLYPPQLADFASSPQHLVFEDRGQHLRQWQRSRGQALTHEQRLDLADQVLGTVSALHQIGVVHGDVKPANIVLRAGAETDTFEVAVVDLGSAKRLHDSVFTDHRVRSIGLTAAEVDASRDGATLLYAAPESLQGGASVAADVYALGVLLYQLFADDFERPLTTSWQRDIDDPALRELLTKATEREPAKRFSSVEELRSALGQLAMRRREIAALARDERARQRRPWMVALIATLCAGVLLSSTFAWQAVRAQGLAETEQVVKAEVTAFLTQFLRAVDPRSEGREDRQPVVEGLRRASASLDRGEPTDLRARLAINEALVDIYDGMGMVKELIEAAQRTVTLASQLYGEHTVEAYEARYELIVALANSAQVEQAIALADRTDHGRVRSPDRQQELERLAALAHARISSASLDFVTARAELQPAVLSYERADTVDERYSTIMLVYAEALARTGDLEQALDTLDVLSQKRPRPDFPEALWQKVRADGFRAQLLGFLGRQQEAITALEPVLEANLRIYGEDSVRVAWTYATLGQQYAALGLYPEAVDYYNRAARSYCEHGVMNICAGTRGNLAFLQFLEGQPERALANLEQAKEVLRNLPQSQRAAIVLFNYYGAHANLDLGRVGEARALLEALDLVSLEQAAPGALWDVRVAALAERIALYGPQNDPTRLMELVDRIDGLSEGERSRYIAYPDSTGR